MQSVVVTFNKSSTHNRCLICFKQNTVEEWKEQQFSAGSQSKSQTSSRPVLKQEAGSVNRSGLQVKSLSQMFRRFLFCVFTEDTRFLFLVAPVRLYGSVFVVRLVDVQILVECSMPFGANLICVSSCACVLFVYFMALFHGSISEMGGVVLLPITHWLLFICLCAPEFTRLLCCALRNSSTVSRAQWGIVDSWRTWSSGWQLGSTKGQYFSTLGANGGLLLQLGHRS